VVLEAELMYSWKGEVPDQEFLVPIGKARVAREGSDLTLISFSKPVRVAEQAAEKLAEKGIAAEVIDLRSLRPLDEETLIASVRKTHRAVVIDEAWPMASVGATVSHLVMSRCFDVTGDYHETSCAGIYAIGDISTYPQLAHAASKAGEIAAERIAHLLKGGPYLNFEAY